MHLQPAVPVGLDKILPRARRLIQQRQTLGQVGTTKISRLLEKEHVLKQLLRNLGGHEGLEGVGVNLLKRRFDAHDLGELLEELIGCVVAASSVNGLSRGGWEVLDAGLDEFTYLEDC